MMVQGVKSEARLNRMMIGLYGELETRSDLQRRNVQHPPQSSKVPAASYGIPIHDESKVRGMEETGRHTAYASRGTSPVPSKVVL
jgi:hypothetical protein